MKLDAVSDDWSFVEESTPIPAPKSAARLLRPWLVTSKGALDASEVPPDSCPLFATARMAIKAIWAAPVLPEAPLSSVELRRCSRSAVNSEFEFQLVPDIDMLVPSPCNARHFAHRYRGCRSSSEIKVHAH
jgi:hypothetical protein